MTGGNFTLQMPVGAALVIGGTGAIGRSISTAFAAAGADVGFTYRRESAGVSELQEVITQRGVRAHAIKHDLLDWQGAERVLDEAFGLLGRIHSVVYAAGPDISTRYASETGLVEWMEAFDVDVHGFFSIARASIPHLRRQGGGTMTSITTTATGRYPPKDVLSAAPKAAIEATTRAIAKEEGRYGIRANSIAPGWIDAGLGAQIVSREHRGQSSDLAAAIPLRQFGTLDEIAAAVIFLSSVQAAYVTGQCLAVDGGWQI